MWVGRGHACHGKVCVWAVPACPHPPALPAPLTDGQEGEADGLQALREPLQPEHLQVIAGGWQVIAHLATFASN